ncbi:MAG: hypothetical protein ACKO7B_08980, partial [Flavobacteriales bacterium]
LQLSLHPELIPDKDFMNELAGVSGKNELVMFAYTGLLMRHRGNDEAIALLENTVEDANVYPLPALRYRLGTARLRKSDPGCVGDFAFFLMNYRGNEMRKSAWQKIGWMRLLQGDK